MNRFNSLPTLSALCAALALGLCAQASHARNLDTSREDVAAFVNDMQAVHGLDADTVRQALEQAVIKQSILDAISKPAERTLKWHEYRPIFITEKRIRQGTEFYRDQWDTLLRISELYGVEPQFLTAIVGVETYYGRITGSYKVLDALSTLAFEYPPRSKFFRRQLEEFFVLTGESGVDLMEATGSYAGAMGAPQFIPSSFRAYAVDDDQDGRIDLWGHWPDVLASVANYFKVHGWRAGEDVAVRATRESDSIPGSRELSMDTTVGELRKAGWKFHTTLPPETPAMAIQLQGTRGPEYWVGFNNLYVITRYNRSVMYAMAVNQLASEITHRAQFAE